MIPIIATFVALPKGHKKRAAVTANVESERLVRGTETAPSRLSQNQATTLINTSNDEVTGMTHKFHLRLNSKKVSREEFHRNGPVGGKGVPGITNTYSEADPLISDGLGCMSGQVQEMRQAIRERGIRGARVLENGQLSFTSRRARAEVCRMRGLCDSDGGYSDG